MSAMPGNQRDDLVRLRWLEDRVKKLAGHWRDDATALRATAEATIASAEAAAELDGCADEVDTAVAESRAEGGPPADHLADAVLHLAAFRAAARAAGNPVAGAVANAINVIEAASTRPGTPVA